MSKDIEPGSGISNLASQIVTQLLISNLNKGESLTFPSLGLTIDSKIRTRQKGLRVRQPEIRPPWKREKRETRERRNRHIIPTN